MSISSHSRARYEAICLLDTLVPTYQSMTYVRNFGRLDLLVTYTCNSTRSEIKEELLVGQSPTDRHDLTARVVKQKLIKFMDVISKYHIYGETRFWMYSIEYQNRSLPDAHILICLKENIRPSQIGSIILAELFETVTAHVD
jgi:hypothetical protein